MKVAKDKVIEIEYTLRLDDGQVIDETDGKPLPYLHGAGNILPGLEAALEGRSVGDKFEVTVPPVDGYGEYNEELTDEVSLDSFPEDFEIAEGDDIVRINDEGEEIPGIVDRIEDDVVIIDYNHPLAGETLTFQVEVVNIREATAEELEQGGVEDPYAEDDDEWDDEDE